jgi:hypothetical protein
MVQKVITRSLVKVAIRLAADGPLRYSRNAARCSIKRSLVDELRRELDHAGFGEDWRTLQKVIRAEERIPEATS